MTLMQKKMWDAIKSRFGGNDESKKMQKYILKQQFEGFSVSNTEGLHKGYDRFQSLLSQLEILEQDKQLKDANKKFLRSLPLPGHNKFPKYENQDRRVDNLRFDDLYNNLKVFESDVKGSTASSSSPCALNWIMRTWNICDEYDPLEEMTEWQSAMISMRMKKVLQEDCRKLQLLMQKNQLALIKPKLNANNCHKSGHFAIEECRIKGTQDNRRRDAWNLETKMGAELDKRRF
ncbi:hypothetical protein Tco_0727801 [Tanacetum coccineum]|uniref:Uncharacterized protein n=1 Tax=Tanacetum coccineum TaxID=301880 RepID=A0ABQ4YLP5_9ASTR